MYGQEEIARKPLHHSITSALEKRFAFRFPGNPKGQLLLAGDL